MGPVIRDLAIGVMPVIVVILSTLGVILAGIATPTDAGAVGAAATFVLTVGSGRMSLAKIRTAAVSTLEISSMILLLVTASNLFGSVFSRLGSADFLAQMLTSLALPPTLMLIVILALIFVLGWPLEWVPIVLIVVPIVLPIVQAAGIDLIWFCTLVAVTLQTAWLSPPVALSAYFLEGRGAAVGAEGHLRRHGAVHDPAAGGGGAAADLPEAGHLAAGAELKPGASAPSATIGGTMNTTPRIPGHRFLHSPGPTRLPDEVLHAMSRQPMDLADPRAGPDHRRLRGRPEAAAAHEHADVLMYAANGHGAWEAVIVNLLGAGRERC